MLSANYSYESQRATIVSPEAIANSTFTSPAERRASRRVAVALEAIWNGMSGNREARVTDLSLHGCFLESCAQTAVGENVELLLKTPTDRWMRLRGQVAFYQPMIGFGMKFVDVDPQDQAMIRQLVEFYS